MKKILLAVSALFCLVMLAVPSVALAADEAPAPGPTATEGAKKSVCEGVGVTIGVNDGCTQTPGATDVGSIIRTGISILSMIVGVAAVVMIIIGGFKYITSGGDSGKVNSAKDTILYAIVGLVVAVLAQVIVQFVLNRATAPPEPVTTTVVRLT